MHKAVRILLVLIGMVALLAVRAFEDHLFYDPLLRYFKQDYQTQALPPLNKGWYFLNLALRYLLNSAISLGIIAVVFQSKSVVKVATLLYGAIGVVLFLLLVGLVTIPTEHTMALFYVRRFLIQPVLLLLLLPAFYFQRKRIR